MKKIPSEKSPDFASGQVLFCLKMLRLNFIVNETPFSLYITIRKKFIRDAHETPKLLIDATENRDKNLEIHSLKILNKEIERKLALARVDYEESEVKIEKLNQDNSKCEAQVETLLKKDRLMNENMKATTKQLEDLIEELMVIKLKIKTKH